MANVPVVDDLLGDFGMGETSSTVPTQAPANTGTAPSGKTPSGTAPSGAAPSGTGGIDDLLGGLSVGGPPPAAPVASDPFNLGGGAAPAAVQPAAAPLAELLPAA